MWIPQVVASEPGNIKIISIYILPRSSSKGCWLGSSHSLKECVTAHFVHPTECQQQRLYEVWIVRLPKGFVTFAYALIRLYPRERICVVHIFWFLKWLNISKHHRGKTYADKHAHLGGEATQVYAPFGELIQETSLRTLLQALGFGAGIMPALFLL